MNFQKGVSSVAFGVALVLGCLALPRMACAEDSPVSYQHIVRRDPNFSIHVVTVNMADPRVEVRVAKGGDVSADQTNWVTTLLPPSEIAEREHFDIAINGDFFSAIATHDIEGKNTGYVRGKLAAPVGPAMTDGVMWFHSKLKRPCLEITSAHTGKFVEYRPEAALGAEIRQIVGGGQIIVRDGKAVDYENKFSTNRHPRTVVGLDRSGTRLTILLVDGRQPNLSIGMTLADLSREMIAQGCDSALNLDGGGSTDLVWRDGETKKLRILNSPSDSKERSVADVLGVTVTGGIKNAELRTQN